jgi:hypothetical protein
MSATTSLLEMIHIANPCHVSWDTMAGDERVRFCTRCRLNVYNISAMTRRDAEHLLLQGEGRTCLRLFRRADGTVLTRDCSAVLRAAPRKLACAGRALFAGALFTLVVAMAALWLLEQGTTKLGSRGDRWTSLRTCEPFRTVLDWINPSPPPDEATMGW